MTLVDVLFLLLVTMTCTTSVLLCLLAYARKDRDLWRQEATFWKDRCFYWRDHFADACESGAPGFSPVDGPEESP